MEEIRFPLNDEQFRLECLRVSQGCWGIDSGSDPEKVIEYAQRFYDWVKTGERRGGPVLKAIK